MIDFKHLKDNNISYKDHAVFALTIGARAAFSSVFFLVHGVLPFVQIPTFLNLESMNKFYGEKNEERS